MIQNGTRQLVLSTRVLSFRRKPVSIPTLVTAMKICTELVSDHQSKNLDSGPASSSGQALRRNDGRFTPAREFPNAAITFNDCSKSFFTLALVFLFVIFPRVGFSDVEEVLIKVNSLPAEERERVLVENAKKEGGLTFYAATNLRDTQEIVTGFNKRYPFVKVAFVSLGGPGVLNKVSTEYRAGAYQADIVTLTGLYVPELIDKKILARYKSPMVPFLRKGFVDPEGYWPGVYAIGMAIIYNTRRVAPRDVPKRYEDLLGPRWKDNMIMDLEAHDLFAGLIDLWGEAKATSFLKSLAAEQKVRFSRQSHTCVTQLVATGEHDLIVDGYVHNAVAFKERKAPIDFVTINPTIIRPPSTIAITSRSPHPHAAALLLDYHLSKEASEIMVKNQGRWAPRKDVPWTVEPQGELHVVSPLQWGPKIRQLVDLFNKSVGQ
jgi:iron(III) transport system substrate-binding protein